MPICGECIHCLKLWDYWAKCPDYTGNMWVCTAREDINHITGKSHPSCYKFNSDGQCQLFEKGTPQERTSGN